MTVWTQQVSSSLNVYASRYTVGSGWGTAQKIQNSVAGNASTPQIAFDAAGNAMAVWRQEFDGTNNNIWFNRYTAGGWDTAKLIELDNTQNAIAPQFAWDANGNAMVVWQQKSGPIYNIRASRFD